MQTKHCPKCNETKLIEFFSKAKKRYDGLQGNCKACYTKYKKDNINKIKRRKAEHYKENKERILTQNAEYRKANLEKKSLSDKRWREENLEKKKQSDRAWYEKNRDKKKQYDAEYRPNYYENNKELWAAQAAVRRCRLKNAMPIWADVQKIKEIYEQRRIISVDSEYEVDHIIPLGGKNVCGLHVHWNLAIIPKAENRAKGNRPPI